MAGEMGYLTDHRALLRNDPRTLLPSAKSMICVGKLYNGPQPYSTVMNSDELGWVSRYAWGEDYHVLMRRQLKELAGRLKAELGQELEWRACVDTAPLLERAYARRAGLGWIGKNSCLIHEGQGSWFFLGELLISVELSPDLPPPDRCGTCTRCIDACPTEAIVMNSDESGPVWTLDARRCISYLTIELRGTMPEELRADVGPHVFGCDICQDVCPWNRKAPVSADPAWEPQGLYAPPLAKLASFSEDEFAALCRETPVWRTKFNGFLRNVAVAMGNSGNPAFRGPLERLAVHHNSTVAEHARWALNRLDVSFDRLRIDPA